MIASSALSRTATAEPLPLPEVGTICYTLDEDRRAAKILLRCERVLAEADAPAPTPIPENDWQELGAAAGIGALGGLVIGIVVGVLLVD